jgi:hypothetical protein
MINPTTHAFAEFPIFTLLLSPYPSGITAGPDGNLWFTLNSYNQLGKINPTTHEIAQFSLPLGGNRPVEITAGPDGNVWFTQAESNQIGMINPATDAIVQLTLPTPHSKMPAGITAGPDGNLWFTEAIGNRIGQYQLNVSQAATTTQLTATPSTATVGDTITLSATVTSTAGTPSGAVSFLDGTTVLNPAPIALDGSGHASFATTALGQGVHSITGAYAGNASFQASTSAAQAVTINAAAAATTTSVTATPSTATVGDTITFAATVTSTAGTPSGTVNFLDGTTVLNATPIALDNAGHASFVTTALAQGTHSITAVYAGNSSFQGSTSAAQMVTINASTPPEPAGNGAAVHTKKGTTAINIPFNVALESNSASTAGMYLVLGAVKKKGKTVYTKKVGIKRVSYNDSTHMVTLTLAKPYKGVVKVTVRGGLKAANGASSRGDFLMIVK